MPGGVNQAGIAPAGGAEGPTGEGWVIQLKGYHYHNFNSGEPGEEEGAEYVVTTLIKNLESGSVELPMPQGGGKPPILKVVPIADLGISCPVIVHETQLKEVTRIDPTLENDRNARDREVKLRRFDFTVQFCWQETSTQQAPGERTRGQGGRRRGTRANGRRSRKERCNDHRQPNCRSTPELLLADGGVTGRAGR